MLEKIKEVPFIDESASVRLISKEGKLVLERNDRVIWASENTTLPVTTTLDCYVEAKKFFTLLPDIAELSQDTCLKVKLKNGAKYELPFMQVSWETQLMPTEFSNVIMFKLDDLMLCTLKNLIKPELQCVYIDSKGAVTCDFVSACISDTVKSSEAFLLPPDVQELVDGRQCKVEIKDEKIYIQSTDFSIITSKPVMSGEAWWEQLREMLSETSSFVKTEALTQGLKRLTLFGDYVSFDGEKALVGENFEPFKFTPLSDKKYEIERLAKILTTADEMSEQAENLVLRNKSSKFLISPMEEA